VALVSQDLVRGAVTANLFEAVVVYDECTSEVKTFTLNERVARELIRAFQHSHSR